MKGLQMENLPIRQDVDVLVLYSGGADSRLMIELARMSNKKVICLLINYGQLHQEELDKARSQLDNLNINYIIVKIEGLLLESALTGSGIQGSFGSRDKISIWHVPGRNTLFAGIALSIAENFRIKEIWHGADFSDRLGLFSDCHQDYVVKMNELFQIAGPNPINYRAPLMGLDKETIIAMLKNMGIDMDDIYSGYGDIKEKQSE